MSRYFIELQQQRRYAECGLRRGNDNESARYGGCHDGSSMSIAVAAAGADAQ